MSMQHIFQNFYILFTQTSVKGGSGQKTPKVALNTIPH